MINGNEMEWMDAKMVAEPSTHKWKENLSRVERQDQLYKQRRQTKLGTVERLRSGKCENWNIFTSVWAFPSRIIYMSMVLSTKSFIFCTNLDSFMLHVSNSKLEQAGPGELIKHLWSYQTSSEHETCLMVILDTEVRQWRWNVCDARQFEAVLEAQWHQPQTTPTISLFRKLKFHLIPSSFTTAVPSVIYCAHNVFILSAIITFPLLFRIAFTLPLCQIIAKICCEVLQLSYDYESTDARPIKRTLNRLTEPHKRILTSFWSCPGDFQVDDATRTLTSHI